MNPNIQGLWVGKERLPLMQQLSIKSFLANGHRYCLYTYQKLKDVPEGTIICDANEVLPRKKIFKISSGENKGSYAAFSDVFRMKLIALKGGFWADSDVVCLKSFDFQSDYVFASEYTLDNKIIPHIGIFKCPPGSAFAQNCYNDLESVSSDTEWYPCYAPMRKYLDKHKLNSFILQPEVFCPLDYWDYMRLLDADFAAIIRKETYAIHLWNEMWRIHEKNRGIKDRIFNKNKHSLNRLYSLDCLYGYLQKKYL